jgi:hypothetical protein
VADALSCLLDSTLNHAEVSISLISFPTPDWVSELKASYLTDQHTSELLLTLQNGDIALKGYSLQQGLILRKGRLGIVKNSPFQFQLLEFIHSKLTSSHSGYHKTIHRAKSNFYWKGMCADIKHFVRECNIC